jgi:protein SCO1/2
VDRETGVVAIRHEAIPGFMPEMTMPFDLKGQDVLEDLQVGDKVRGTLRIEQGEARLSDVEITELAVAEPPAPPPKPPTLEPGEPVPDFAVTMQDGQTLRLSELRGKVVVITFIYTRCPVPNFCPLMDKNFAELARWVEAVPARAEEVRLLSISFDPEHDTPEALAAHAKLRGAKPPVWRFAVASHEELRKVAGPLGLSYAPTGNEIIHGLATAVIDRQGRLARLLEGNSWKPEDLRQGVAGLLDRPAGR